MYFQANSSHISSGTATAPRKPPRRNFSVSPVRGAGKGASCSSGSTKHYNTISTHKVRRHHEHSRSQKAHPLFVEDATSSSAQAFPAVYSSKSGSKSFDELDDLLNEKSSKKNSPTSMDDSSRHSCDELMMTRSLYEAETSDTASQVQISGTKGEKY